MAIVLGDAKACRESPGRFDLAVLGWLIWCEVEIAIFRESPGRYIEFY